MQRGAGSSRVRNPPVKGVLNRPGLRAKFTCISKHEDGPRMIPDYESIKCLAHSVLSKRQPILFSNWQTVRMYPPVSNSNKPHLSTCHGQGRHRQHGTQRCRQHGSCLQGTHHAVTKRGGDWTCPVCPLSSRKTALDRRGGARQNPGRKAL